MCLVKNNENVVFVLRLGSGGKNVKGSGEGLNRCAATLFRDADDSG